jgi:hypothetical protein
LEKSLEQPEVLAYRILSLFVGALEYLGYCTQTRPYILATYGGYWTGFTDCFVIMVPICVILIIMYLKLSTTRKKATYECVRAQVIEIEQSPRRKKGNKKTKKSGKKQTYQTIL